MSTKLKSHNLDTRGWNEFPFEFNGIQFISKISNESPLIGTIKKLSIGQFQRINQNAVEDLIDDTTSLDIIAKRLIELNTDASHSVLELA